MSNSVVKDHVSGEAPISVGTATAGALEVLGLSVDGVEIQLLQVENPVMADIGGNQLPVDFQHMGEQAFVTVTLSRWNEDVLRKIRSRPFTLGIPAVAQATPADGLARPRGQLIGAGGAAFKLVISAQYEDPWHFYTTKIVGSPQPFKVGTVVTNYQLRFHAWTFIPGNLVSLNGLTAANLPKLYDRALPT
jgi:hypothetical protein